MLFMSKSFHGVELSWNTQDKEYGAIYKRHLLYNRHFLSEIDNKNLTFLNTTISSQVYRWKLALQRYAFNIRHLVGKLNVVGGGCIFMLCVRQSQHQGISGSSGGDDE